MKMLLWIATAFMLMSIPSFSQGNETPILTLVEYQDSIHIYGTILDAKLEATAFFKNDRTTTHQTWMKVDNSELFPGHSAYFCWDLCYTPGDTVSLDFVPVQPGTTYPGFFSHLEPNNTCGISRLKYTIFDGNNVSDNIEFWIIFNVTCDQVSVNESFIPKNLFKFVSNNEFLQVSHKENVNSNYSYEILTPNGNVVQKADFSNETTAPLNNLASGQYYVIIRNNSKPVDFYPLSIQR
jgi:hypothetical protein